MALHSQKSRRDFFKWTLELRSPPKHFSSDKELKLQLTVITATTVKCIQCARSVPSSFSFLILRTLPPGYCPHSSDDKAGLAPHRTGRRKECTPQDWLGRALSNLASTRQSPQGCSGPDQYCWMPACQLGAYKRSPWILSVFFFYWMNTTSHWDWKLRMSVTAERRQQEYINLGKGQREAPRATSEKVIHP